MSLLFNMLSRLVRAFLPRSKRLLISWLQSPSAVILEPKKRKSLQVLRAGALGWPRGMGWGGRWKGGSGWGTHVDPWLIHVNVWQKPLQYCRVISLQLKKINGKKKIKSLTVSIVSPSICHEVMVPDVMILAFWMLSFKPAFSLSSFTFHERGCLTRSSQIFPNGVPRWSINV